MSRFYINFQNGDQIAKDDEGIELPSLDEARKAALRAFAVSKARPELKAAACVTRSQFAIAALDGRWGCSIAD